MKDLDYGAIKDAANKYSKDMTAFLRAMISHPSESLLMATLIPSELVIVITGTSIPMRALRTTSSLVDAVAPTKRAACAPVCMPPRS